MTWAGPLAAAMACAVLAAAPWTPPRAADGHADISGLWENNSATPLERPAQFAGKPLLSDAELADLNVRAARLFAPDQDAAFGDGFYTALLADANSGGRGSGTYSANWLPDRNIERRTSLIFDPPDGRLPPFTAAFTQARAAAAAARPRFARGPEDMFVTDRCISYGVPDLFAAYMSVYRIMQSRDAVVIAMEKIHDTRIVPLDGRPHISPKIRHYLGDPRGRWEGDTLVVETTNFTERSAYRGASVDLKMTERFTPLSASAVDWSVTFDDPRTWTRSWTFTMKLTKKDRTQQVFEYACHEGNYAMPNILSAQRSAEKASGAVKE